MTLEAVFVRRRHAAYGISFQMFPGELIRVAIRCVGWQIKELKFSVQGFDKFLSLFRAVGRASIDS